MKRIQLLLLLLISVAGTFAQQWQVKGSVFDGSSNLSLPGANLTFNSLKNDKKYIATTSSSGEFTVNLPGAGQYELQVSFIGYEKLVRTIKIERAVQNLGKMSLKASSITLKAVEAEGCATRAIQKNDTMEYNATAFKTLKGSTSEDLIAKMPGIIVSNGTVKVQGEEVKKVLVDGKPFFDNDVTAALRNIPSDIVSAIQVFDKKSEQAQFTGFDDGQSVKTLNIVTREDSRTGYFGKMTAAAGTEDRYQLGGSVNYFKGDRRITITGQSNNVNQQNFTQEDILGSIGSGSRNRGGGGPDGPPPGAGGPFGGGGSSDNNIGQLGGLSTVNALGFNYTDKIGTKVDVTGGYFFNASDNYATKDLTRTYFDETNGKRVYTQNSTSSTQTYNHRFNLKFDYAIDDKNSLTFVPRVSLQKTNTNSTLNASTTTDGVLSNQTSTTSVGNGDGYNMSGMLLYRHKFDKAGRTISLGLNCGLSDNDRTSLYTSTSPVLKQQIDNLSSGYNWGANVMYTEPLSKNMQLMTNYNINYSYSDADRKNYNYNGLTNIYQDLDTALSNVYNTNYLTQRFGTGIRFANKKVNTMVSLNYQRADLDGTQQFPTIGTTSKSFSSILPMAMADIKFNSRKALRLGLFSSSAAPSVSQLQDVIDNTNSLALTSGNSNLKEQISTMLNARYTYTSLTGQTFIAMVGISNKLNYIGDSTYVAGSDQTLKDGIVLSKGSQFTKPVNMDGYWSVNSMLTYGMPFDPLRSNLNLSTNLSYSRLPGIYNGARLNTNSYNVAPTMVMSSNISENLDFTFSYNASWTLSNSTKSNTSYLTQNAGFKIDWITWLGMTLGSQFNWQDYTGSTEPYYLWNASLGKKIFKNQRGEVKFQAYDLLHQNKAISHTIATAYAEDATTNILKPYFMLSFVYDLRVFNSKS
ncbi:outer membrane beta-barrel protein [Parabacteroides sp. FAFU027]|uniref:outer membrane beta-barrel protein n=1 Tax=Parabacteroides sp. FAFU027 TaxID=2922715 RepID=UPI001FAEA1D6|nr:outer membrane beta-barrel protein [Parabacteroides sp. FAFU027]